MDNLNINLKSEFRSRFNAGNGGSQYSSEYRPLYDDFFDSQVQFSNSLYYICIFQIPPHPIPWRAIILATLLFVFGTILIVIGTLLLAGFCDPKYNDRTWPVLILGLLMFIPGLYHVRIAYYAFKGYKVESAQIMYLKIINGTVLLSDIGFIYFTCLINAVIIIFNIVRYCGKLPHAIADFFEWFVHQILFYREVYPQESFEMVKFCNYPCYVTDVCIDCKSSCPYVIDYIREWHSILSATCEPGEITVIIQIEDPAMRKKLIERYYLRIFIRGSQGRKLLPNWKNFENSLPDIISRLISVTEVENVRHPLKTESNHYATNSERDSGAFVPLLDGRIVPIGTVASDNMKMNIFLLRPIN
ncbi:Transmembrane protein [Trichinella pseudospiralis]|uniref:Transmembrane protein 230 n=1 Tax=Trichinella pseudospiralis TaxID=6337 RepID=A0A0V1F0S6_TRIPS|nr:Transmembrane protein [Trichinella pseudospiralis]